MNFFEASFLGLVQGLTEFLPVSSSGHLVLFQYLLGIREPMLAFDIAVHGGTLLAVLIFFRRDLADVLALSEADPERRKKKIQELFSIGITFSITAVLALVLKFAAGHLLESLWTAAFCWLIFGSALASAPKWIGDRDSFGRITFRAAVWIGIFQGFAVFPGISRSGSTILAALFLGFSKKDAIRYSFLNSIPVIAAATLFSLMDSPDFYADNFAAIAVAFVGAAVVGYGVIWLLIRLIERGGFFRFGYYCLLLSALSFALLLIPA